MLSFSLFFVSWGFTLVLRLACFMCSSSRFASRQFESFLSVFLKISALKWLCSKEFCFQLGGEFSFLDSSLRQLWSLSPRLSLRQNASFHSHLRWYETNTAFVIRFDCSRQIQTHILFPDIKRWIPLSDHYINKCPYLIFPDVFCFDYSFPRRFECSATFWVAEHFNVCVNRYPHMHVKDLFRV